VSRTRATYAAFSGSALRSPWASTDSAGRDRLDLDPAALGLLLLAVARFESHAARRASPVLLLTQGRLVSLCHALAVRLASASSRPPFASLTASYVSDRACSGRRRPRRLGWAMTGRAPW